MVTGNLLKPLSLGGEVLAYLRTASALLGETFSLVFSHVVL